MIKTFTKDDLIRYIYRETTEQEEQEINQALTCDVELNRIYTDLCALKQELDHAQLEPSQQTITSILEYSRSRVPVRHH